jgi:hypothetical protein
MQIHIWENTTKIAVQLYILVLLDYGKHAMAFLSFYCKRPNFCTLIINYTFMSH